MPAFPLPPDICYICRFLCLHSNLVVVGHGTWYFAWDVCLSAGVWDICSFVITSTPSGFQFFVGVNELEMWWYCGCVAVVAAVAKRLCTPTFAIVGFSFQFLLALFGLCFPTNFMHVVRGHGSRVALPSFGLHNGGFHSELLCGDRMSCCFPDCIFGWSSLDARVHLASCSHVAMLPGHLAQCLMEFILPIALLLCLMELLLACCSGLSSAWEGLDFAFMPPSNKGVVVLPASTIATTASVLALAFSTPRHAKVRFTLLVVAWCATN
jgi:hypothetical protein